MAGFNFLLPLAPASIVRLSRINLRNVRNLSFALVSVAFLIAAGTAQTDPAAGILPFSTHAGGTYDSIDLATSAILIDIPVRAKVGKIPLNFSLVASNHIFKSCGGNYCTPHLSASMAGRSSAADLDVAAFAPTRASKQEGTCNGHSSNFLYYSWAITDGTGAAHSFPTTVQVDQWGCYPSPSVGTATDGSGYTLVLTTGPHYTVYDRSGNQVTFVPPAITTTDLDGVQFSLNQTANSNGIVGGTYTDTLGEVAITSVINRVASPASPDSYTYTDVNGNSQTYSVNYSEYTQLTNFQCNDLPAAQAYLATSISLPDGTNFSITYEQTPGYSGNGTYGPYTTGRIASMTIPNGGSTTYGYSGGINGLACPSPATASFVVPTLTRTIKDNNGHTEQWTYVNSNNTENSSIFTVTVQDPANNHTVYTFSNQVFAHAEYQTEKQVYQGTISTQNLIDTVITCYNGNFTSCPSSPNGYTSVTQTDIYSYPGTSAAPSLVETKYDSYGNIAEVKKYGYGATLPPSGSPVSDTTISHAGVNGVSCGTVALYQFDQPCSVTIVNSAGSTISQVNYTYTNGHPTKKSTLISGSTYLTSYTSYNSNGTASSATDVNNAVTNYYYNGTGSCNNLLLTSTTLPVASLHTSQTWNCNGGAVAEVTDTNGQQTNYGYVNQSGTADPFWRVRSTTDPLGNVTWNTYTPATPTTFATAESVLVFNGGLSAVDQLTTFDGLGRTIYAQTRQGPAPGTTSFDSVQYVYNWDSTGAVTTQSVPYSAAASTAAPANTAVTTTQYDALGRTSSATDGGGGTQTYIYSANDVQQTLGPSPSGETTKQKQLEYDGLGRLASVCEITSASGSGSCGQSNAATGFLTTYTYDALGNLQTVTQNAQPGAIGGQQGRSYTYDGLSRLLSETNPEWGPGTANYTYDAACGTFLASAGDKTKSVDHAGNTTCYGYDGLHRRTGIAYPSGPYSASTPPKTFVYDATTFTCTNASGSYVKGRLAEAFTGSSSAKITDIAYCYSPRGETTDAFESTPNSGGYYHITAGYWANRALNSLTGVPGLSGWTFTPDGEGRPYTAKYGASTNWVTSTTYYPSNASNPPQNVVSYGNGSPGDTDLYGFDANTGRMNQFQFNISSTPITITGAVGWNANWTLGTLGITVSNASSKNQNCSYIYDALARIDSVNCLNGSTTEWNQSFTLDPFGNISKSGTSSFAASYLLTNGTTNNQEQSVSSCLPTYDGDGNLTKDCTFATPYTYTWDADGNPINLNGVGITYDALDREVEIASGSTHTQVLYGPIGKLGLMSGQTANTIRITLPGGSTMELLSGATHILHSDWLGSARISSTYSNRTIAYDTAYAPYGESYDGSSSDLNFTRQSQDTLSGLYDFLYRKYNPVQGRWISPDPAGWRGVNMTNPQTWNRYAYVNNNPLNGTDPTGLFRPNESLACDEGDVMICSENPNYEVDGVEVSNQVGQQILSSGAGVQCPNNICQGPNQYGLPVQYRATAVAGYYVALIPGVWPTAKMAGQVAVGSTNGQSIATNTEVSGNVYEMQNGKYSWTSPGQGNSDSSKFDPTAIPDGTTYAGSYHDHAAFDLNYDSEQFSPNGCNHGQLCDIGLAMSGFNQGQAMFLGTPAGRTEMFDPSQFGAMPFGCVLVGSAVSAAPGTGTSSVAVPTCR